MSINKKLRDEAIYHRINLVGYENNLIQEALKLVSETDKQLTAQLYIALEDLSASDFKISRLESMLGSVKSLNSFMDYLFGELQTFSEYESNYQYSLFESLLPDIVTNKYPLMQIAPQQLFTAVKATPFQGRLLSEWVSNIEDDRLKRVTNTVRTGYVTGETTEQIIRKVRGTKKNNYKDGVLESSKRNVSSLIYSAVSHTAAVSRDEFSKANNDIIKGKQWLSTLDTGTTPMCIIRDLKQYTLDNKPIGHDIPYGDGPGRIHFCCRSVETFITKSYRELGIDIDEAPEGTRASMNGQVPAKTSYLEWLKSQPQAKQEQALGVERAKLLQEGKITGDTFFTNNGRFLTLDELKNLDGFTDNIASLKSIEDIEKWMTGRVSKYVKFPDGVTIDVAKDVAQVSSDFIERFNLPPIKWMGTKTSMPDSVAGAFNNTEKTIHMTPWALNPLEWENISKNTKGMEYKNYLQERISNSKDQSQILKLLSNIDVIDHASVQTIKGTIAHEFGHYLYYQRENELVGIVAQAYENSWGNLISFYATESPKELFSESISLYLFGNKNDINRINPDILKWLKQNDKK